MEIRALKYVLINKPTGQGSDAPRPVLILPRGSGEARRLRTWDGYYRLAKRNHAGSGIIQEDHHENSICSDFHSRLSG
jgi:hypothetical protein